MRRPLAVIALSSLLLFPMSLSLPSSFAADQSPVAAAPQAQDQEQGQESNEQLEKKRPRHHVDEDHENGFDFVQIALVGGAVVIAAGLAYRAGRRRRDA